MTEVTDHLRAWFEALDELTYYELFRLRPDATVDDVRAGFCAIVSAAHAQQPSVPASTLPVKQVTLFTSGVAYTERGGQVEGDTEVPLTFRTAQINDILKKTGGGLGGAGIFFYGAGSFCSPQKADEVKQFFQQHPFPGTERNQKEAIETINGCVDLRNQQQNNLAAWLKQNANANASISNNIGTTNPAGAAR